MIYERLNKNDETNENNYARDAGKQIIQKEAMQTGNVT